MAREPKPWRNVCEGCKQPVETMALYAGQYLCPACVVVAKDTELEKALEDTLPKRARDYDPNHPEFTGGKLGA